FLAREELEAGRLDAAGDLARKGIEADPRSDVAALGHYVLADVFNRRGQPGRAQDEVAKARRLEAATRGRDSGPPWSSARGDPGRGSRAGSALRAEDPRPYGHSDRPGADEAQTESSVRKDAGAADGDD